MSVLSDESSKRLGSMALLSRKTGISERLLREIGDGLVEPDQAHIRRIKQFLGKDLPDEAFPHHKPEPEYLDVREARVLAVRDEHIVRPHAVKRDDLIRLVAEGDRGPASERVLGWVKVKSDARWVRGDLVEIDTKQGFTIECHPAQTVTVARRPPNKD